MIKIDKEKGLYTLSTKGSTYQMKVNPYGVLLHTYYGKRVGEQDMSYTIHDDMPKGHKVLNDKVLGDDIYGRVDHLPLEISCYGCGDYRESTLSIRNADGTLGLQPVFHSARVESGKYSIPSLPAFYGDTAETLIITLKDRVYDIFVHLYYGVFEEYDLICRSIRIENKTDKKITVEKALSLNLDLPFGSYDLVSFRGKWAQERIFQRTPIMYGKNQVFSTRGASGHMMNPFCIVCDKATTEVSGDAYGVALVYSGSFLMSASKGFSDATRLVAGINPESFSFALEAGEVFCTPEACMCYSSNGFGEMSRSLHRAIRNNLCRGKFKNARRPILINNWEGTYFDFNADKLVSMAKDAQKLGVELFVMDDGWFGKRDNDWSGLGDWYPNEKKLGCTLGELSRRINDAGLKFGIWFEPECVSEDSDLFRAHPDYAFRMPNRQPTLARHQLILDFSRKEVRDNIYNQIKAVLDGANISYVKWDYNRNITDLYSADIPAERQGEVLHRYMLGLYELLERLTSEYPDVLFESCSGGGGRFDLGMHHYMPQAWTSDDTDPIERLKIQYGTSFCYPISTMGAHVSASPNHQTGRVTPLKTRGTVAYFGTYGLELDVNKMTDEEKEEIKRQICEFKEHYELIQRGDYYRLISPFDENSLYCAWSCVSADKSEAIVACVRHKNVASFSREAVRLQGLDENKRYTINGGTAVLGSALMSHGLLLDGGWGDYPSFIYHLRAID